MTKEKFFSVSSLKERIASAVQSGIQVVVGFVKVSVGKYNATPHLENNLPVFEFVPYTRNDIQKAIYGIVMNIKSLSDGTTYDKVLIPLTEESIDLYSDTANFTKSALVSAEEYQSGKVSLKLLSINK